MRIDPRAWAKLPLPTLGLAALTAAVGVTIIVIAAGGTCAPELLATPARPPAALAIDVSVPAARDLAAIQAQPLLHASRTFHVVPPDAAPAAPPRPDYRLAGTLIVPHKPAVALLVGPQGGAGKRLKAGDQLDGWTIESVQRGVVMLTWRNERLEISATQAQSGAGLKRVPLTRQRVASTPAGVQALGATGDAPAATGGPISDQPRLYRPPPN